MDIASELASGTVRTRAGAELRLGEELGGGYEGMVFRVKRADQAVKIYHEDQRGDREQKLWAMIANPPVDPTPHQTIVWPTDLVESVDSGHFLGYVMTYLDLDGYENALQYAYNRLAWSQCDWNDRCKVALNLARAVALTHVQGHALGDMNHQNILVKGGKITLIDCDAFDVQGPQRYFSGSTEHPRYAPPGGRGNTQEAVQHADRFGLGVHIFQLLMRGFHPFQTRGTEATPGNIKQKITNDRFPYLQPEPGRLEPNARAPAYDRLPSQVRSLFEACFVDGKERPAKRPTPETWDETLGKLYDPDGTTGPQTQRRRRRRRSRASGGTQPTNQRKTTPPSQTPGGAAQQPGASHGHPAATSETGGLLRSFAVYLGLMFGLGLVLLQFFPLWVVVGILLVVTMAARAV
jgi:DNA-binding helix-hairpin-helix protein with protein kinase domain